MTFQMRQSKFRHVFGKPLRKDDSYDGIRLTKVSWDTHYCAVNRKYIAVLSEAGKNSSFLVHNRLKTGRIQFGDVPLVTGHKGEVLDIAWDPFNDDVIASCGDDLSVKVWLIPEDGLKEHLEEPAVSLDAHQKRVGLVRWHPVAKNILLSAGHDSQIFIWNVGTAEMLQQISCHPDAIYSVSFNWRGDRIVTSCKDRKLRVINPRNGEVLVEGTSHEGSKSVHVQYIKDGSIFSTGFSKRSNREYALWKESNLENLVLESVDGNNGTLFPVYDPDLDMMYLIGKGDCQIRYFELTTDAAPYVHYLSMYQSTNPQRGFGFMPKLGCNVNETEIMRIYKLLNNGAIEVVPLKVPRKSEQFQSDIFPDTRSDQPALSASEWFDEGKDSDPIMQPMSELYVGDIKGGAQVRVKSRSNVLDMKPGEGKKSYSAESSVQSVPEWFDFQAVWDDVSRLREQVKTLEERVAELQPDADD